MPISGTHSIVGATIGFSIVLRGWDSIRWMDMLRIVASWFASPLLSGLISSMIYILISKTVIRKVDPLRYGLKALPLFYGVTIFINVASIVIDGPEVLGLNQLPWYAGLFIALMCAGLAICCVAMILVPRLRKEIMDEMVARKLGKGAGGPAKETSGGGGYDNVTFSADEPSSYSRRSKKRIPPTPPPKPRREVTLEPSRLVEDSTELTQGRRSRPRPSASGSRPPLAPKPAHLCRQERLEEIDLSPCDGPQAGGERPEPAPPSPPSDGSAIGRSYGERYEVSRLFASLQILTACFASFAHGTNDVSNAVAPLIPIWNIYTMGSEDIGVQTQIWILAFGSIGICSGLWAWGRAVMGTVADGITKITPSKGFSIELGAAISVLLATKLGLPISTTHCKVGSLVIVGLVSSKFLAQDHLLDRAAAAAESGQSRAVGAKSEGTEAAPSDEEGVDWKMFGGIALTWVVTVPFAAIASALVMWILKWLVL